MDIDNWPFIGSEALQAGVLNRHELRRHYRAIMPNVYVNKRIDPSLPQRAAAAWLWSRREAVVAGSAASSLLGVKWIPDDVAIELIWENARPPRGVITRDDLVFADEVRAVDGLPVTTPERTAFDIGRRGPLNDAVARLDALCAATGFNPGEVLTLADEHPHCRGLRQLERALDLCDPGAQSPQESRLRMLVIAEDFPRPQTQIPVLGPDGSPTYFLDMGWEDLMLAIEYDGAQHASQLGYDIVRSEYLAGLGWIVVRVAAGHRKSDVLARVNRAWDLAVRRRNPAAFTLR
ncbi:endonuclease domain-containing protein [Mycobacterium sp. PDNC021]|uniref:endonuclease domain-containing protein n=1 Tax=Mycobacterium sp. PDNC021 TaxID=3391399 RepID=UPI003AB002AA